MLKVRAVRVGWCGTIKRARRRVGLLARQSAASFKFPCGRAVTLRKCGKEGAAQCASACAVCRAVLRRERNSSAPGKGSKSLLCRRQSETTRIRKEAAKYRCFLLPAQAFQSARCAASGGFGKCATRVSVSKDLNLSSVLWKRMEQCYWLISEDKRAKRDEILQLGFNSWKTLPVETETERLPSQTC